MYTEVRKVDFAWWKVYRKNKLALRPENSMRGTCAYFYFTTSPEATTGNTSAFARQPEVMLSPLCLDATKFVLLSVFTLYL